MPLASIAGFEQKQNDESGLHSWMMDAIIHPFLAHFFGGIQNFCGAGLFFFGQTDKHKQHTHTTTTLVRRNSKSKQIHSRNNHAKEAHTGLTKRNV